jgi:GT2 family glycosyltransferase
MISVVYCTREHKPEHSERIRKAFGHPKVEVIEYVNSGEGLTKYYDKGLREAKHDIVVFLHDDIVVNTKQVANKIVKLFEKNPEYGILGVAGTKNVPASGMWWEDRRKMYGRVEHTHEGKTWLSAYSKDLDNDIEEVVTVDGLFFSVHKGRIKEQFDLSVTGFHFYEVDFCFRNHLKGVKIGVHTNVRVNHMSIGQTNAEWEENRLTFADKYKEHLPVTIKKTIRPNERLNVLIGALNLNVSDNRGKFTFEFIKKLKKDGHNITVSSLNELNDKRLVTNQGIRHFSLNEPPNFKLGDGKWSIMVNGKAQPSNPKTLYKVGDERFDCVHLFDDQLIEHFSKMYSDTPVIGTAYTDGLFFINSDMDNRLSGLIQLDSDTNKLSNNDFMSGIYSKYFDVL